MKTANTFYIKTFMDKPSNSIEEIIQKWDNSYGLSENYNNIKVKNISLAIESVCNYIIKNKKFGEYELSVAPVIVRIFREINEELDSLIIDKNSEIIANEYYDYFEAESYKFTDGKRHEDGRTIDQEAEAVAIFAENYKLKY